MCAADWPPPLAEAAFQGLAGRFVRTVAPHTEADEAALLIQFLVSFGNVIGRGPHFRAEADCHYTNLFAVLVGDSSKGRKGTSRGHIERIFRSVDPDWTAKRVMSGLSSGEGLVHAVRDPVVKKEPIKDRGRVSSYEDVVVDHGVEDKRLLVVESEMGQVFQVLRREANTLSAIIRQAWDGRALQFLTKTSPASCGAPHISFVGHVTRDELIKAMNAVEVVNGFANRILWIAVRRSQLLPEGGRLEPSALEPLIAELSAAVDRAREAGELGRDDQARVLWCAEYPSLTSGGFGLSGSATSRAEAQTMRLAMLYALLDRSPEIRRHHLEAGLAVWRYAEDSARYAFGDGTGDRLVDRARVALDVEPLGLSRTDLGKILFSTHATEAKLAPVLDHLERAGFARRSRQRTLGRSAERWTSTRFPDTPDAVEDEEDDEEVCVGPSPVYEEGAL